MPDLIVRPNELKKVSQELLLWAQVDLDALRRNFRQIKAHCAGEGKQIMAIVKADAYGHGMKQVARALLKERVSFFGVASCEEAVLLRRWVGSRPSILLLGCFTSAQAALLAKHDIRPTLSSWEDTATLLRALKPSQNAFPVHVKVDTGMGRMGISYAQAFEFLKKLHRHPKLRIEGIYTHFSCADKPDASFTHKQIKAFKRLMAQLAVHAIRPRYFHAANSMGSLHFDHKGFDLLRPGIVLYGIYPGAASQKPSGLDLVPILSLKTRVGLIKEIPKGFPVSYGATYRAPRKTRIAVLPIGYSDGYRVAFSGKTQVLIRGKRYPVVGRVTMDQIVVDIGPSSDVKRWDEVTLIGSSLKERITPNELALAAGTIPYEITCAIHPCVPRVYIDSSL